MKILYFTQFYSPEPIAAAFRARENSLIWRKQKADVTIFTGYPNYPKGKIFDGYLVKKFEKKTDENGITIIRSKVTAKPNTSFFKRAINYFSFYLNGLSNIRTKKKNIGLDFDVVLASSGTIFSGILGFKYSKKIKKPFVLEIRDITYRQLIATGKSKKSFIVKMMKRIELNLCKKASKVVVVTEGFKQELIKQGIPVSKIEVITNGVNVHADKEYHHFDGVHLSYFGTLGISQNISTTFKYLQTFKKNTDHFTYTIIGEGAQKEQIINEINNLNDKSIKILPGMDSVELERYYKETNLSIVTLINSPNFAATIPSKLFQIMGRGIPVLFIGPKGEASHIIEDNECGIALTGTVSENIQKLDCFLSSPNSNLKLKEMAKNGINLVKEKYDRTKLALHYLDLLSQLSNG